ncbi:MAG TPA: transcription elongation factor Spt5 [Nitrososphaeraceae archaeon]|jgi:transcriptional antiterminator NusG|nr:transcription elongation factor Spt5 [Nitrososphaeraceae archaeon]
MSDTVEENEDDIVEVNDNFEDLSGYPTTSTDGSSTEPVPGVDVASQEAKHDVSEEEQAKQAEQTEPEETKPDSDSKFFAIRTTGGQEHIVANILQNKINAKSLGIRSILALDNFKGYIIVEAPDSNVAYEALSGIRHARGQIRGELPFKDIEGYLIKKPVVSELNVDDTVEVIAGPFKAMKAKITRVDYEKQEATVVLLDSPYQIPVTVDANYLKKIAH